MKRDLPFIFGTFVAILQADDTGTKRRLKRAAQCVHNDSEPHSVICIGKVVPNVEQSLFSPPIYLMR